MRVAIVGCGAVGSLFAAHLAQLDDVEVWAYDLDAAHVDAINASGLGSPASATSSAGCGRRATRPSFRLATSGSLRSKSMHTGAALAATAHAFEQGAVCSVQNGIGNEELVAAHVHRVIRGTTFPAGHVIAPGHVGWDTAGDTWIGRFEPSPARWTRSSGLRTH